MLTKDTKLQLAYLEMKCGKVSKLCDLFNRKYWNFMTNQSLSVNNQMFIALMTLYSYHP